MQNPSKKGPKVVQKLSASACKFYIRNTKAGVPYVSIPTGNPKKYKWMLLKDFENLGTRTDTMDLTEAYDKEDTIRLYKLITKIVPDLYSSPVTYDGVLIFDFIYKTYLENLGGRVDPHVDAAIFYNIETNDFVFLDYMQGIVDYEKNPQYVLFYAK